MSWISVNTFWLTWGDLRQVLGKRVSSTFHKKRLIPNISFSFLTKLEGLVLFILIKTVNSRDMRRTRYLATYFLGEVLEMFSKYNISGIFQNSSKEWVIQLSAIEKLIACLYVPGKEGKTTMNERSIWLDIVLVIF